MAANKLSLNVNKTYYLVFHRARMKVDNDNSIRMNDSIINSASHLKYLRVIIDSKLNWIPHITYVKNTISKGIGIMFKAKDYLNKNCLSNLHNTYIFPYGVMRPIVIINYFSCFNILETFSSYRTYIQSLNIIPLNSLYYYRIWLLMYKLSNGLLPEALNQLYIKRNKIDHYPTRNCYKYHIQTSTDSFSNVSARIWNVITTNIDVNISFMQFKIVLKLYLHENEVILKCTK